MPSFQKYIKEDKQVATEKEHRKKYRENKNILENELSIDRTVSYNWIATIAFYSVLHLVEGKLATYNIHSKSHTASENMVNSQRDFRNIRTKYKTLHTRSIVARYSGENISKDKAMEALQYLKDIERELGA